MVRQPAVFLMDEPLSNLDAALRISMRAEIKHLHTAMQTTFVYVTHDQAEALTLADRIVVMKDGVIQQVGSPDEVYERPRNMFVAVVPRQSGDQFPRRDDRAQRRRAAVPLRRPGDRACRRNSPRRWRSPPEPACSALRARGRLCRRRPRGRGRSPAYVDSVLPVGSDRFLGLKVEGRDVFVRVDKADTRRASRSGSVHVVAGQRLHLFDKASGLTLAGEGAP